jgi:hypothetical protein
MPKMLALTDLIHHERAYVNAEAIRFFRSPHRDEFNRGAVVEFDNEHKLYVEESPEKVLRQIKGRR